ncbi:MAG TPA: 8-amino-7-oxononanoate synthase [Candidatus Eisenbacteria bacterium]|jgi:8-amino-7-oxononanoate synthase|nr:8-amino-7-oxononanoate synthase [Candidatus Eisenbacteria bacterium]
MPSGLWRELEEELAALKRGNLHRSVAAVQRRRAGTFSSEGESLVNFGSNDYLGLSCDPRLAAACSKAASRWGGGSGASRLVSGNLGVHVELEGALADFKKEEAATVFSSGYLANLGAVTALLGEKDVVLVDRLNHASLLDAARLSRAKLWVYPHADAGEAERLLSRAGGFRRRLVVTDAYFSMDGDVAPLAALVSACRRHDASLLIDEAHSTGVYGPTGAGCAEAAGLTGKIDVTVGTLSKALGGVGGFVAGSRLLKEYLTNRSRPYIYTTAPAPAASAAALAALKILRKEPLRRARLWRGIRRFREAAVKHGFDLGGSEGPVAPIVIGDPARTVRLARRLREDGFYVPAIRFPSVPKGGDRLRVSITAAHSSADLDGLIAALVRARGAAR